MVSIAETGLYNAARLDRVWRPESGRTRRAESIRRPSALPPHDGPLLTS